MTNTRTGRPNGRPKGRKTSKTAPSAIAKAEKMGEALAYRRLGHSFEVIGGWMGISKQYAHELVCDALAKTLQEPADDIRRLEMDRLDAMLAGVMQHAIDGDTRAIDSVLKITERRAALLGLDAPKKIEAEIEVAVSNAKDTLARKLADMAGKIAPPPS